MSVSARPFRVAFHKALSLRLVFASQSDDHKRQPVGDKPQDDPFFAQSEQLEDLHVDPQPVDEQENVRDQVDQRSKCPERLSFLDRIIRDHGDDEQQVHDAAVHAFPAQPDAVAQTVNTIPRNPGRPFLFPAQLARDHEQGD